MGVFDEIMEGIKDAIEYVKGDKNKAKKRTVNIEEEEKKCE